MDTSTEAGLIFGGSIGNLTLVVGVSYAIYSSMPMNYAPPWMKGAPCRLPPYKPGDDNYAEMHLYVAPDTSWSDMDSICSSYTGSEISPEGSLRTPTRTMEQPPSRARLSSDASGRAGPPELVHSDGMSPVAPELTSPGAPPIRLQQVARSSSLDLARANHPTAASLPRSASNNNTSAGRIFRSASRAGEAFTSEGRTRMLAMADALPPFFL